MLTVLPVLQNIELLNIITTTTWLIIDQRNVRCNTHGVHYEVQLSIVDGYVDSGVQQTINNVYDGTHEVSGHVTEHLLCLGYTHKQGGGG